jgi:hypothetical protein
MDTAVLERYGLYAKIGVIPDGIPAIAGDGSGRISFSQKGKCFESENTVPKSPPMDYNHSHNG